MERARKLTTTVIGLGVLDEEHSEIQRRYLELDQAILYGVDMAQIRSASEKLTSIILLHLAHEEEFLMKMRFPFLEDHCEAELGMMAEMFKIELDLRREELSAPLRLRNLCREWLHQHVNTDTEELKFVVLVAGNRPGLAQA